jgi:hypothetical protein
MAVTASIPAAFTLDKSDELAGSVKCGNPVCHEKFAPSGLAIEPKRFCSNQCRMTAWFLKKAREAMKDLSDDEIVKVIRG